MAQPSHKWACSHVHRQRSGQRRRRRRVAGNPEEDDRNAAANPPSAQAHGFRYAVAHRKAAEAGPARDKSQKVDPDTLGGTKKAGYRAHSSPQTYLAQGNVNAAAAILGQYPCRFALQISGSE